VSGSAAGPWVVIIAVSAAGCGGYRFALPGGSPEPAASAASAWAEGTRSCRDVRSYSATLTVSGHVGSSGVPKLTVFTGVTSDGGIYLDGRYNGTAIFTLGGTADRATLVLHNDQTTVTAPADQVLDALVGLKMTPSRWLALVSGCVTAEPSSPITRSERSGSELVLTLSDARVLLASASKQWRITGGVFDRMTIEYRAIGAEWPQRWTLASEFGVSPQVKLDVAAADPHVNDPRISPAGFAVTVPAGAVTITLDELRAKGLGGKR
jgi:hypothetical protein